MLRAIRLIPMLAVAVLPFVGSPVAAAAEPPTLTGETLSVRSTGIGEAPLQFRCSDARSSYTYSGTATGPYAGTFTESGTVTYTVPPPPGFGVMVNGQVTELHATFTIVSPSGIVTGTKRLDPRVPGQQLRCGGYHAYSWSASLAATYIANVATPSGNYRDRGASTVDLGEGFLIQFPANTWFSSLDETFASAIREPALVVPTRIAQCKHGGWKHFPQFKNQRQCVRFVKDHTR